jgi:hypothetical protein
MNGSRYEASETVEGRLAAVMMELLHTIEERNRREKRADIVDYADIREALRPYVQKEIVHARIQEVTAARNEGRNRLVAREATLQQELAELEGQIVGRKSQGSEGPRRVEPER